MWNLQKADIGFGVCLLLCQYVFSLSLSVLWMVTRDGLWSLEVLSEVADQRGLLCFVFSDSPLYLYTANSLCECVNVCSCLQVCMGYVCACVCVCARERGRRRVVSLPPLCRRYWLFTSVWIYSHLSMCVQRSINRSLCFWLKPFAAMASSFTSFPLLMDNRGCVRMYLWSSWDHPKED